MMKKLLIVVCFTLLFLQGCGKSISNDEGYQNEQLPLVETTRETVTEETVPEETSTEETIDYSQYIGKTWIEKNGAVNVISFSIQDIVNGELTGQFSAYVSATPSPYDIRNLTGTVNADIAKSQFSDSSHNEGTIEMIFKENNEIEATITFTSKSKYMVPKEGEFLFRPFNLDDLKEYDILEERINKVNLNSWGDVRFVPVRFLGGAYEPEIGLYLADHNGDILYRFFPDSPRGVDLADVAFVDLNKDMLKDFVIMYEAPDYKGDMFQFAMIFLQREDGKLIRNVELDEEVYGSISTKGLENVIKYLQDKF
jgi:hypothetical protein